MGEVTPGMARSVMNDHKFSNLIPGQKPESGKQDPEKIRLYVTACFLKKMGFREYDRACRELSKVLNASAPGKAPSSLAESIQRIKKFLDGRFY